MAEIPDALVDELLETMLPCTDIRQFRLRLARMAEAHAWGQPDDGVHRDGQPLERFLWGLATRYREYRCPVNRTVRTGLPFTYGDIYLVKFATKTESVGAAPPDAAYLARLLGRSEEEAAEAINRYGPAAGRKGFF